MLLILTVFSVQMMSFAQNEARLLRFPAIYDNQLVLPMPVIYIPLIQTAELLAN